MAPRARPPFESVLSLRDAMDELFNANTLRPEYGPGLNTPTLAQLPPNVYEVDDASHVEALIPGIRQEDVNVAIDRGVLSIVAKRQGATHVGRRWLCWPFTSSRMVLYHSGSMSVKIEPRME